MLPPVLHVNLRSKGTLVEHAHKYMHATLGNDLILTSITVRDTCQYLLQEVEYTCLPLAL